MRIKLVASLLLSLVAMSLVAVAVVKGRISHGTAASGEQQTQSLANDVVEVEVVTVRRSGFEPLELRRPPGPFMLAINNRTELNDLSLRLDQVNGSRLLEARMAKGRIRWNQTVILLPGEYVLSEENHPEWVCRIVISIR